MLTTPCCRLLAAATNFLKKENCAVNPFDTQLNAPRLKVPVTHNQSPVVESWQMGVVCSHAEKGLELRGRLVDRGVFWIPSCRNVNRYVRDSNHVPSHDAVRLEEIPEFFVKRKMILRNERRQTTRHLTLYFSTT